MKIKVSQLGAIPGRDVVALTSSESVERRVKVVQGQGHSKTGALVHWMDITDINIEIEY